MKASFVSVLVGLSILLIMSQNSAFSCPVCFGALDDPATNGMNFAIITLLGVTGSVLAGFISFFLRLRKLSHSTPVGRSDA